MGVVVVASVGKERKMMYEAVDRGKGEGKGKWRKEERLDSPIE